DLQAKFEEAVKKVREGDSEKGKAVPDDRKLLVYALYKQATEGDVNTKRPGMLDFKGKAKWDAWKKQEGKSKEDAMRDYIAEVEAQMKEFFA
ncbi:DBI, partial [Symbiodinium sp. KB8]